MDSIHVTTIGHADSGARSLRAFLAEVHAVNPAPVTLLCHSYGSVVCGKAARSVRVSDIAVFGSPGMGVDSVSGLDTGARVWAGRGASDGIADVPHVQVDVLGVDLGFGNDPVDPAFGARPFDAGTRRAQRLPAGRRHRAAEPDADRARTRRRGHDARGSEARAGHAVRARHAIHAIHAIRWGRFLRSMRF